MSSLLAIFLAAAAPAAEAPAAVIRKPVVTGRLVIPDEIAPAVVPYMRCLLTQHGVEIRGPNDPRPPKVERPEDCTQARKDASQNADALLRQQGGRSRSERREFIEKNLLAMEEFAKAAASQVPAEGRPNASNR